LTESFPVPPAEEPDPQAESEASASGSRRTIWIVAALVVLVAGAAGLWLGTRQRDDTTAVEEKTDGTLDPAQDDVQDPTSELPEDVELTEAVLYFAGSDGRLYAESRELPVGTPAERARLLVAGLLSGPEGGASSGLRAPLPAGSHIEQVYLLGTTAVLDLRPPAPRAANPDETPPAGPPTPAEARLRRLSYGSMQELLAVYSLVNTVVLGVEGIDSVQLLWDGRQPETFAGHVDTTRPLSADPSYLASK
jgi:hypothetical protein